MVLLSLAIAHANGSLVSAVVDEERPQASRPSCPSTVWVASMSRTRGGSAALCEPGWCSCEPNTIDLPFPDQVPLRSGIASCARVGRTAAQTNANAKTRHLIVFSRVDGHRRVNLAEFAECSSTQQFDHGMNAPISGDCQGCPAGHRLFNRRADIALASPKEPLAAQHYSLFGGFSVQRGASGILSHGDDVACAPSWLLLWRSRS